MNVVFDRQILQLSSGQKDDVGVASERLKASGSIDSCLYWANGSIVRQPIEFVATQLDPFITVPDFVAKLEKLVAT